VNDLSLNIRPDEYMQGSQNAPLIVIEYGDYECPYSRMGYRFAQLLLKNFSNQVCFAFRNFPLRKKHPNAQTCAEAALCAGKQNRFWEMHDLLFSNNQNLSMEKINSFVEQLELDEYTFNVDLQTHSFAGRVSKDFRSGVKNGVRDTPTFFINQQKYDGKLSYKELKKAVQEHLAH